MMNAAGPPQGARPLRGKQREALPRGGLTVPAPAKVNLFLHVTGRRADGYHTIESLFALVDLADAITVGVREDGAIVRMNDVPGVPAYEDLAIRAARALQRAADVRAGASIAVDKRIPMGGGLGGGSSDAASVLLALNRLWNLEWPRARLCGLGATLGADVPFFVGGENAIARGIGEALTPVTLPTRWLVIERPPVHVNTGAVFASPDLTRDTPSAKISVFSEGYGRNDLAPVTAARFPEVAAALARDPGVRMTGSGACVFVSFPTRRQAEEAMAARTRPGETFLARTLTRHPLWSFAR
ncbi:MAG: 4-(cytidine 5'-diphospho)-2-C-methyl-D-erythritol kinase [Burkholderiales bacterium]